MQADHAQITRLLNTAKGQLDGILKMIEDDRYCIDISNQLMATEAILNKANKEIISAHMKHCLLEAQSPKQREAKVAELITLLDKMNH